VLDPPVDDQNIADSIQTLRRIEDTPAAQQQRRLL
jgi:hypothetical protein